MALRCSARGGDSTWCARPYGGAARWAQAGRVARSGHRCTATQCPSRLLYQQMPALPPSLSLSFCVRRHAHRHRGPGSLTRLSVTVCASFTFSPHAVLKRLPRHTPDAVSLYIAQFLSSGLAPTPIADHLRSPSTSHLHDSGPAASSGARLNITAKSACECTCAALYTPPCTHHSPVHCRRSHPLPPAPPLRGPKKSTKLYLAPDVTLVTACSKQGP